MVFPSGDSVPLRRVAHVLRLRVMSQRITQRELRNDSGRVMRALDKGKSFVVTRNGVPVGELIPLRQRVFVPAEAALAAFAGAPRVRSARFRKDLDARLDQDPTPRA
jgi:antitoxin (DNA-binding transcriptional repressor) of toxin-antitoxin stability system